VVKGECVEMITLSTFDNVLFVKGTLYGTAFCLNHEDHLYVVAASHLYTQDLPFKYKFNKEWVELEHALVGQGKGDLDIVVLKPKTPFGISKGLSPASSVIAVSQQSYFMGFPYKMDGDGGALMHGRPCAFIRSGIISAAPSIDDDPKMIFVDAIGNEGFSGGPLLVNMHNQHEPVVVGVITHYRTEQEAVIDDGGKATSSYIMYNTGLTRAVHIKHAIDMIAAYKRNGCAN